MHMRRSDCTASLICMLYKKCTLGGFFVAISINLIFLWVVSIVTVVGSGINTYLTFPGQTLDVHHVELKFQMQWYVYKLNKILQCCTVLVKSMFSLFIVGIDALVIILNNLCQLV